MINDIDRTDAIFLIARHGNEAPQVAGTRSLCAGHRGDPGEAKRWRAIRSFIEHKIA